MDLAKESLQAVLDYSFRPVVFELLLSRLVFYFFFGFESHPFNLIFPFMRMHFYAILLVLINYHSISFSPLWECIFIDYVRFHFNVNLLIEQEKKGVFHV